MGKLNDVKRALREAQQLGLTEVVIIGRLDEEKVYVGGNGGQQDAMALVRDVLKAWTNDEMK